MGFMADLNSRDGSADSPTRRSWWSRNWKWLVPVGCLVPILVCGGLIALIFGLLNTAIKSSEPYQHALAQARAHPDVIKLLGQPIEPGRIATGNIHLNNDAGDADLYLTLNGPNRSAIVHVMATKVGGVWNYSMITLTPHGGGDQIDLVNLPGQRATTNPRVVPPSAQP